MGLKWGAIGNTLGEHIGNLGKILETWEEHVENKGKMEKNPPPSPPKLERKQIKAVWVHAEPFPLATWNFYVPKLFVIIFGLG